MDLSEKIWVTTTHRTNLATHKAGFQKLEFLRVQIIKWDASFRWSFGPICAWGSIKTMTIGTTHPTLVYETQKRITDRLKIRKADFGFI